MNKHTETGQENSAIEITKQLDNYRVKAARGDFNSEKWFVIDSGGATHGGQSHFDAVIVPDSQAKDDYPVHLAYCPLVVATMIVAAHNRALAESLRTAA